MQVRLTGKRRVYRLRFFDLSAKRWVASDSQKCLVLSLPRRRDEDLNFRAIRKVRLNIQHDCFLLLSTPNRHEQAPAMSPVRLPLSTDCCAAPAEDFVPSRIISHLRRGCQPATAFTNAVTPAPISNLYPCSASVHSIAAIAPTVSTASTYPMWFSRIILPFSSPCPAAT